MANVKLPPLNQILSVIQQAAMLDWGSLLTAMQENSGRRPALSLTSVLNVDSMAIDRMHGVCPIPLYEFTEQDWEMLLSGARLDDLEERLKTLGIYQYFFPAPDQVALGLVDRDPTPATIDTISAGIELTPSLGHPLGATELVRGPAGVRDVVEQLQDLGLLVEGEFGLEVTEAGTLARSTVRFRPREGVLSKLLQRLKVNVSISSKDFLPPG
jgi:hypothetical protein